MITKRKRKIIYALYKFETSSEYVSWININASQVGERERERERSGVRHELATRALESWKWDISSSIPFRCQPLFMSSTNHCHCFCGLLYKEYLWADHELMNLNLTWFDAGLFCLTKITHKKLKVEELFFNLKLKLST